jgi:hypothetical protein
LASLSLSRESTVRLAVGNFQAAKRTPPSPSEERVASAVAFVSAVGQMKVCHIGYLNDIPSRFFTFIHSTGRGDMTAWREKERKTEGQTTPCSQDEPPSENLTFLSPTVTPGRPLAINYYQNITYF